MGGIGGQEVELSLPPLDRSLDAGDLCDAIASGIDVATPTECLNHFAAAGYDRE